ncbi:MAG TPA: 30S ribosomal protein S18 [Polyangiaceae bacterium]|nr:30S ribosomal protein S18 [Polyangiaceae bacterium]
MSSIPPKADDGSEKEGGFRRVRRRGCPFCNDENQVIDYKDPSLLRYFVTDRGKIVPRRVSSTCAKHQRDLTLAIKRARVIAFLPFTTNY